MSLCWKCNRGSCPAVSHRVLDEVKEDCQAFIGDFWQGNINLFVNKISSFSNTFRNSVQGVFHLKDTKGDL